MAAIESRRGVQVVATAGLVATTLLMVVGVVLTGLAGEGLFNSLANLAVYPFALVGALIATKRPGNAVGWLCLVIGLAFAMEGALWGAALYGLADPGSVPTPEFLAILGDAFIMPSLFLMATLLLLLFPDGHLPSPRWRWLAWTSGVLVALTLVVGPFLPTTSGWGRPRLENPYASQLASEADLVLLGLFPCVIATVVALVRRFRASRGIERLQMRWLATAGSAAVALWLFAILVSDTVGEETAVGLSMIGWVLLPLAMGVAVMRYRLFEIDRVISRTVTYALVIGVLVAVYAGGVLVLRNVLPAQGDVAVAASTLAVAALFNPVRRRVRERVDRRFNRARYDGQQELDRFAGRLRDELDLDDLTTDLLSIVSGTMQPSRIGVWVRQSSR